MQKFYFHSLIPELKIDSGHHYFYHQNICRVVQSLQGKANTYVNRKYELQESWHKWFDRKRDPKRNPIKLGKLFLSFHRFYKQLQKKEQHIVFYEVAQATDLFLFALASLLHKKRGCDLWILARFVPKKKHKTKLFLLKWLSHRPSLKCRILTDSRYLVKPLKHILQTEIVELPHYFAPSMNLQSTLSSNEYHKGQGDTLRHPEKIHCSFLGGARGEKGAARISRLLQSNDPLRHQFQFAIPHTIAFERSDLCVDTYRSPLTREEYLKLLYQSHVILLPYHANEYRCRLSGVFVEAICAGKIPLVTKHSALAKELQRYALDELIINWDETSFFSKLFPLIQEKKFLKKLEIMQKSYLQTNSQESFKKVFSMLLSR